MVIPIPKASRILKLSTTTTYIQTCSGFIRVLYRGYTDVPLCPFPDNPPNIDDFSFEASIYVEFPMFDYWTIFWWRYPILAIRISEGLFDPQLLAGSPRNHHVQWILTVNGDANIGFNTNCHVSSAILHYGSKYFLRRYLTHLKFQIFSNHTPSPLEVTISYILGPIDTYSYSVIIHLYTRDHPHSWRPSSRRTSTERLIT